MSLASSRPGATEAGEPARHGLAGAALAAGATLVALIAVVALTDSPRRLQGDPPAALTAEFATGAPEPAAVLPPVYVLAPATGFFIDPGLQTVFDVYA